MNRRIITSLLSGLFLAAIAAVFFVTLQKQASSYTSAFIAEDIKKLSKIFETINNEAKIVGFTQQQNVINFLTITSVEGSTIGSLEVAYPDKWAGPYIKDDLSMEGKEYMVVRTKEGYFITPGNNVTLGNGKKIGTDIVLTEDADILAMMQDRALLNYRGNPLAARLTTIPEGILIADNIARLSEILERIDTTCKIISFDAQKNPINFLTVRGFAGSEVGSMNMSYPTHWQGPYLHKELSIQGIPYMVVKTTKGYFITPGDGVRLPSGKVIGTDIVLDEKADIEALIRDEQSLMFEGKPLAALLSLHTSFFEQVLQENAFRPEDGLVMNE